MNALLQQHLAYILMILSIENMEFYLQKLSIGRHNRGR